jgi:hypothetical protein
MSDGGKGSKPRPFNITQEEYDNRWDTIFQRDLPKEEVEDLDPAKRTWYYDNEGVKRKKTGQDDEDLNSKEVKIKATIPDLKIKGSVD